MALELGALREALIDAGASPDKAIKAAEELAGYESRSARLHSIDARLQVLTGLVVVTLLLCCGLMLLVLRLPHS